MADFKRPTMLMILDGYGINPRKEGNAIAAANKPHLDEIFAKYPGTTLKACGLNVGDEVRVKVIEIDSQGRINLSRKDLL